MNFSNEIEIIIVTYNRSRYLKRTLEILLNETSPVRNCKITIQDNHSSDNTRLVTEEFSTHHTNVSYRQNKYNIGISGNIFRAMELAAKKYVWILGDDDAYDFSGWSHVESAMERGENVICIARYCLPDELKESVASQLVQISFVTGCIYKTTLFNDASMRDAIYNVFNLFPHLMPVVHHVNNGGKIFVVPKAISDNGLIMGEDKDSSYNRGISKMSVLSPRVRNMRWIVGWASVCQAITNDTLKRQTLLRGMECIHGSNFGFFRDVFCSYRDGKDQMLLADLYVVLPFAYRFFFKIMFFPPVRVMLLCIVSLREKLR